MIKTHKELQKEGWIQISTDIWLFNYAQNHYLFYNTKTCVLGEHVWSKSFEKNLTYHVRNHIGIDMTKSKFFKTYGEEEGKMIILISIAKLYTREPMIYYSTQNGKRVYLRQMVATDPNYRNGMKVVAYLHNEEIIGKHFDNVISNLIDKRLISSGLDKKWQRENKFNRIVNPGTIKEDEEIDQNDQDFPLEKIIDQIDEDHIERVLCGKPDPNFTARVIQAKAEIMKEKGSCTVGDIIANLKIKN